MRTLLLIYLLLFCSALSLSAKLAPHTYTTAFYHLAEVNERWMYEISPEGYLRDIAFVDETARIRYHLMGVHDILSQRSSTHLSAAQVIARQTSLCELLDYAVRGRFPLNTSHPVRTPYFVDANGTHCAVGYLMHRAGDDALVSQIRSETNNGYVIHDLLQRPSVGAWASAHGFTAEELAWIQPGYPGTYLLNPKPFGRGLGVDGGQVLATAQANRSIYLAGDFTEIDGTSASVFARVQGTLVTPVLNEFSAITQLKSVPNSDLLFCTGTPKDSLDATRLALFDASTETFVAQWNFEAGAKIYVHVDTLGTVLVLVGEMVDITDTISMYTLSLPDRQLRPAAAGTTLIGTVYDSYVFAGVVMFGGELKVVDALQRTVDSNQVRYDISLDNFLPDNNVLLSNPDQSLTATNAPVYRFYGLEGYNLRLGAALTGNYLAFNYTQNSIYKQNFETVEDPRYAYEVTESRYQNTPYVSQNPIADIKFSTDNNMWLSGSISRAGSVSDPLDSSRLYVTSFDRAFLFYTQEIPIDGTVSGIERVGDSLLIVGDFTSLAGVVAQQLVYAIPQVSDVSSVPLVKVGAYVSNKALHLSLGDPLNQDAQLFLYAADGRFAQTATLSAGEASYIIPLSTASGVLFFALKTSDGVGVGSVVVTQGF